MNEDLKGYIDRLRLEDVIWYVYIALVVLNIISNKYEKRHVLHNNLQDRNIFRSINIFVFTIAIFIYAFFIIRNVKYTNKNSDENVSKLNNLSFLSSIIFFIGGIINLYIEINGFGNELEI